MTGLRPLLLALSLMAAATAANATADPSVREGDGVAARAAVLDGTDGVEATTTLASTDARYTMRWVAASRDNRGQPFAVVDKKDARIYVFDGRGHLIGQSVVLTGAAKGDGSVPGIGARPVADIKPFERTTPAGRFASQPGRNLQGETIVWVDYDTGIAIHRLRPGKAEARRAAAMATPTPDDNRQSYGCVVVPPAFFDAVIEPVLGHGQGVVYVMPEEQPVTAMFGQPQLTRVALRH